MNKALLLIILFLIGCRSWPPPEKSKLPPSDHPSDAKLTCKAETAPKQTAESWFQPLYYLAWGWLLLEGLNLPALTIVISGYDLKKDPPTAK